MGRKMKLLLVAAIATMSLLAGGMPAVYAQAPEADVFAVIKLNNLGDTIGKISEFVNKIQPGLGGIVNPMMVGQMVFHNQNWAGMNQAGEYTVVVFNPMTSPQSPVALIIPLTDKDEYLKALTEAGLTGGAEANGILTFTQANQKPLFAAFTGDVGILAEDQNAATQAKALVDAKSPALTEVPAIKGQVVALVAFAKMFTAFSPMLEGVKQQMLMNLEKGMPQGEGAPPQPAAVKNILLLEVNSLLSLLQQVDKLQLGVNVEAEGLRLSKAVFPVEGSNAAKFMAAQTAQKSALAGFIPQDGGLLGSGAITFTPELTAWYAYFTKALMTATPGADAAAVDQMAQWVAGALEAFGGEFAFGGLNPAGDAMVTEIFTLKDPAKAKQMLEQYPAMIAAMTDMYKGMGLDFNMKLAGKEPYQGGEILNFALDMKANALADPKGMEAFNKIFGDKLTLPFGFTGKYGVLGLGKDPLGQVQVMMDGLKAGAAMDARYTPVMFGLPEENNLFMYLSIPKIVAWASQFAPDAPKVDLQESPGVALSAKFVKAHLEGELFVPVAEILAIKTMAEQMQAQKGALQQEPAEMEDVEEEAPAAAETPTDEVTEPPAEQSK